MVGAVAVAGLILVAAGFGVDVLRDTCGEIAWA